MKRELNEEIKRIKSLFNEDRLYGNIIREQKLSEYKGGICQYNPWKCKEYMFVKNPGNANSNVYNYSTLSKLDHNYGTNFISEDEDGKGMGLLEMASTSVIGKVKEQWKTAIEGEYFRSQKDQWYTWDPEWNDFAKGFNMLTKDINKDLVNVSKVIAKYPNFIDDLEENFGTDFKDDKEDFYKYFVKYLTDLPYAHSRAVAAKAETDTAPAQEAQAKQTFENYDDYRVWVESQISAFEKWDKRKKGGKTKVKRGGDKEEQKKNKGSSWDRRYKK